MQICYLFYLALKEKDYGKEVFDGIPILMLGMLVR